MHAIKTPAPTIFKKPCKQSLHTYSTNMENSYRWTNTEVQAVRNLYTMEEIQCNTAVGHLESLQSSYWRCECNQKMALGESLVPGGQSWWPVPITEFL